MCLLQDKGVSVTRAFTLPWSSLSRRFSVAVALGGRLRLVPKRKTNGQIRQMPGQPRHGEITKQSILPCVLVAFAANGTMFYMGLQSSLVATEVLSLFRKRKCPPEYLLSFPLRIDGVPTNTNGE